MNVLQMLLESVMGVQIPMVHQLLLPEFLTSHQEAECKNKMQLAKSTL